MLPPVITRSKAALSVPIPNRVALAITVPCLSHADLLIAYLGGGSEDERSAAKDALYNTLHRVEPNVHAVFDVYNYKSSIFRRYMKRHGF